MFERILLLTLPAFAAGGIGLFLASRRVDANTRRRRFIKWVTYLGIVHGLVLAAWAGPWPFTIVLALVALGAAVELRRAGPVPAGIVLWAAFLACAASLVILPWTAGVSTAIWIYLVVAAFDGFAQVVGQILGRRPLAPRISPSKTIEGVIGGLAGAVLFGVLLRDVPPLSASHAALWAAILSVAALAGDLGESWVKRRSGLKDFGVLIPGHGGVLDRFDSYLAAAAAFTVADLFAQLVGQLR